MTTPASTRIAVITEQLNAALIQKAQLMEQVQQNEDHIKALRNVLAGVGLGREVATEDQKPK